jgi:hypothetical protein
MLSRPQRSVEERRAERALFFWSARETISLALYLAFAVFLMVSLAEFSPHGVAALISLLARLQNLL